jgi:hypothetical protein
VRAGGGSLFGTLPALQASAAVIVAVATGIGVGAASSGGAAAGSGAIVGTMIGCGGGAPCTFASGARPLCKAGVAIRMIGCTSCAGCAVLLCRPIAATMPARRNTHYDPHDDGRSVETPCDKMDGCFGRHFTPALLHARMSC